ncbi:MAG: hypothetical protein IPP29_10040 [Bacteroidetes bacterium]|nr:hypothetical protein [Bacteroidota bacterium]
MKHNKKYIFIILVMVAIYALVEYTKEKPIDWTPTYINTQKKPLRHIHTLRLFAGYI